MNSIKHDSLQLTLTKLILVVVPCSETEYMI